MALLEQTFLMLLQIVSLNIDELGRYFIYSLPSLQTCQSEKLWAFTICNCSKENGRQHYIVKKCDASEKTVLTVHFQLDGGLEINENSDRDRRVLTHIFIGFCRVHISAWGNKSKAFMYNAHKLASLFATNFEIDPLMLPEVEKENSSPTKAGVKRKSTKEKTTAKKKSTVAIDYLPRDYAKLCTESFKVYRRAKDSFLNFVEGFNINIDTSFVNDAEDKLRNQIQKILKLKLHQDQSAIFGTSVNCGEIEAEYKHLVSFKNDELKNIAEHKAAIEAEKKRQDEEAVAAAAAAVEAERVAAERATAAAAAAAAVEAERVAAERAAAVAAAAAVEAERVAAERAAAVAAAAAVEHAEAEEIRLEADLIAAAQQAEAWQSQRQQHQEVEEGEITKIERLQQYYKRAIEVAASYAIYCENFAPCLRPINCYPDHAIRTMRAQSRSALLASEDIIMERQQQEQRICWHGPVMPQFPTDLPDLVREVERLCRERR